MRVFGLAPALLLVACGSNPPTSSTTPPDPIVSKTPALRPELNASLDAANADIASVTEERRAQLDRIAAHVTAEREAGKTVRLLFICTHNSRRSHMGQLWAAAAARYFGIDGVETFSGGTEATAFNPRAVAALRRAGFSIEAGGAEEDNPKYSVSLGEEISAQEAYSKRYMDPPNPSDGFVAVMTCSDADKACPFVAGADLRIALPYVDPKVSDGTPEEAATYDERSRQIAREMVYLFSRVPSDAS
jgi:arsenate reductase